MSENQEVQFTVGKPVIPADYISFTDKIYGERHFLRKDDGYTEVTKDPVTPIRTHIDRTYTMHEPTSFIEAVKKYGDNKTGIIFYELPTGAPGSITMFFDQASRKEKITLPLQRSLEFRHFFNGSEKKFNQKEFVKLLDTFPECVPNVGLLRGNVERLQMSAAIDFESNIDPNNIVFTYAEKGGAQDGKIPRKIKITLPFFEGSKNKVEIDAELNITMPKEENAKPQFTLTNVKHERTEREALTKEIGTMNQELTGWIFVNGKHQS